MKIARPTALAALLLLLAFGTSSCALTYVARAAIEEGRILWRRQPVEELLARDDLPEAMRDKLELSREVRAFAESGLGFEVGGIYGSVAEVDDAQVVHVVTAAPRDAVRAHTWWFPIVGSVPYRGFFDLEEAEHFAAGLAADGFDTHVRPSVAFSTLGWFDDPILSTMLRRDRVSFVSLLVHELVHVQIYIPGNATFNESLANCLGWLGAAEFFRQRGEYEAAATAMAAWNDSLVFSTFLSAFLGDLEAAYADGLDTVAREKFFTRAKTRFADLELKTPIYDHFERADLNNAVLVGYRIYAESLSEFDRYFGTDPSVIAANFDRLQSALRRRDHDPYAILAMEEKLQSESKVD